MSTGVLEPIPGGYQGTAVHVSKAFVNCVSTANTKALLKVDKTHKRPGDYMRKLEMLGNNSIYTWGL